MQTLQSYFLSLSCSFMCPEKFVCEVKVFEHSAHAKSSTEDVFEVDDSSSITVDLWPLTDGELSDMLLVSALLV